MPMSAQLKIIVTSPAVEIDPPSRGPDLPQKDNEPGSVEVLLAANRWWRANPWPEPLSRTTHLVRCADARGLDHIES